MNNYRHPSNNCTIVPPDGWNDTHALRLLPITATEGKAAGTRMFVSWWKPTPDELSVLLRGGLVQLACVGGQPAVRVETVEAVGAVAVSH